MDYETLAEKYEKVSESYWREVKRADGLQAEVERLTELNARLMLTEQPMENELSEATTERDRYKSTVDTAHAFIRNSLKLAEDQPHRFDFYAQEIDVLTSERDKYKAVLERTKRSAPYEEESAHEYAARLSEMAQKTLVRGV